MESRLSVPNGAELKAAQKQVREVFESDFKQAKSVEAKWQLAQKLNREAT